MLFVHHLFTLMQDVSQFLLHIFFWIFVVFALADAATGFINRLTEFVAFQFNRRPQPRPEPRVVYMLIDNKHFVKDWDGSGANDNV